MGFMQSRYLGLSITTLRPLTTLGGFVPVHLFTTPFCTHFSSSTVSQSRHTPLLTCDLGIAHLKVPCHSDTLQRLPALLLYAAFF